ncbi:recombinase family protein [Alkanindiges hydrocarboniclasticus]|uniref:recombinase family protein n=1 Tax=Alkanindiges hydrocarboniclasticus TaxID=1907941 RepID=UPI001177A97C|nr:recombinase family protein [Alkanindiges hydrocarboniclasticus]
MVKHAQDDQTVDIEEVINHNAKTQTVGYIRVSSVDQNTERQLVGLKLDKVFTDKISGAKKNRPALDELIEYVREGDTVLVHSMDRMARDLENLINIVKTLNGKGVTVKFNKENITFTANSDNPMDKFLFHVVGAVAEFKRALIREAQREGIAVAKRKGKYKGRKPALTDAQLAELKTDKDVLTPKELTAKYQVHYQTIWRYIKKIKQQEIEEKKLSDIQADSNNTIAIKA